MKVIDAALQGVQGIEMNMDVFFIEMNNAHHHSATETFDAFALMLHRLFDDAHAVRLKSRVGQSIFGQDRQRNDACIERCSIGAELSMPHANRPVLFGVLKRLLLRSGDDMCVAERVECVDIARDNFRRWTAVRDVQ